MPFMWFAVEAMLRLLLGFVLTAVTSHWKRWLNIHEN